MTCNLINSSIKITQKIGVIMKAFWGWGWQGIAQKVFIIESDIVNKTKAQWGAWSSTHENLPAASQIVCDLWQGTCSTMAISQHSLVKYNIVAHPQPQRSQFHTMWFLFLPGPSNEWLTEGSTWMPGLMYGYWKTEQANSSKVFLVLIDLTYSFCPDIWQYHNKHFKLKTSNKQ